MERRIEEIAKELNVKVVFAELEGKGYYYAALNVVVINESLSYHEKLKVILHELGHVCQHKNNYQLYKLTYSLHSKMEKDANLYMLEKILDKYIEDSGLNIEQINCINFLEQLGIDLNFEDCVKMILSQKLQQISKVG